MVPQVEIIPDTYYKYRHVANNIRLFKKFIKYTKGSESQRS